MKKSVETLLDELRVIPKHDSIIAGGYVRDSALDRDVKDVDVFYHYPWISLPSWAERNGFVKDKWAYQEINGIQALHRNDNDYIYPVQLIRVMLPPSRFVTEKFDWNICKCYYNILADTTVFTEKFVKDVDKAVLTLEYDERWHNGSVLEHGRRIKKKYPWPMVIKYVS
jgi:hypothetical protein